MHFLRAGSQMNIWVGFGLRPQLEISNTMASNKVLIPWKSQLSFL